MRHFYVLPRPFDGGALFRPLCRMALAAAALASGAPAFAQQAPQLPTRTDLDRGEATPPPAAPRLRVEGDIERSPCALADPSYANIKLTLSDAVFNNLGPVDPAELRSTYADYIGKELPIATICEIRDAAATILRAKGYLAAVQVPVQRIESGVVTFEVLYAKVTTIRVLGDPGPNGALLERYLERLTRGQVFNRIEAERQLLLARDIPGYDVRLSLRPAGTGAGEMVGEVRVVRTPVQADFNVQNFGSRQTGRFGGQLRAQFNGITGMGDRTIVALYSTADFQEQQILQLSHDMFVGSDGLRVGGRFTYAWTKPDLGIPTPVKARTLFASLEASYPFLRTQAASLRGAIGFDYVDQDVYLPGVPISQDHVRVAFARLDFDALDVKGTGPGRTSGWRIAGSLEVRQGLSIFDSSPDCLKSVAFCANPANIPPSLFDGNPQATVIRLSGVVDVKLTPAISFSLSPRAQIATSALLAFEQYSAGSYTVGRGYDPGAVVGDHGAGFQAELRADGVRPLKGVNLLAQPFVFLDSAWVWDKNAAGDPYRLTSVGGGVRVNWDDRARIDLIVAVPTHRPSVLAARGDTRVLLSVTTNLWPWGKN